MSALQKSGKAARPGSAPNLCSTSLGLGVCITLFCWTDWWLVAADYLAVPHSSVALIGFAIPTGWGVDLATTMEKANYRVTDGRVLDQLLTDLQNWQRA